MRSPFLTTLVSLALILAVGCARPTVPVASEASRPVPAAWRHPLDAPVATGEHGMVVTDAPLATRVGIDVLRSGGSAVDAAIAVAFALAVVWPEAGNIGGGGLAVLHVGGRTTALDFRERAPAVAYADMFLDARGEPTSKSVTGHLAAGVPGSVAGLWELHRRHGTKPWPDLLQPAIALAEQGFVVEGDLRPMWHPRPRGSHSSRHRPSCSCPAVPRSSWGRAGPIPSSPGR